ncbi:MAG TPA: hypothetical protein VIL00_07160, partial [Pseudonocardiaceae bacterium]
VLTLSNACLTNENGDALSVDRATIKESLFARNITANGKVRLPGAHISGQLDLSGARLTNENGIALSLGDATIGGSVFISNGFTATGEIRLSGTHIGGQLALEGARLTNKDGDALLLDGATVDDGLVIRDDFTAVGQLDLSGARINGELAVNSALLINPDGTALNLDGASVEGDLLAGDGFTAVGEVRLFGARVSGQLALQGTRLINPDGTALNLVEAQATRLILLPHVDSAGLVNLRDARVGRFTDDPEHWPPGCQVDLDGFSYERLSRLPGDTSPACPIEERLRWMRDFTTTTQLPGTAKKSRTEFSPTPYEQLATALRRDGQERQARQVSRYREHLHHRSRGVPGVVWGAVQRWTIGYGYQPVLALAWVLGVLAAGTFYFTRTAPLKPIKDDEHPTWDPFLYTLDQLIPLLDLGHEKAWDPTGWDKTVTVLLMVAGWVLVTSFAAGASRVLRRP